VRIGTRDQTQVKAWRSKGGNRIKASSEGLVVAAKDAAKSEATEKGLPPMRPSRRSRHANRRRRHVVLYGDADRALVRLFSTILKRENGKHFLVTPVTKTRRHDAPGPAGLQFNATRVGSRGRVALGIDSRLASDFLRMPEIYNGGAREAFDEIPLRLS
jgi:hypothetical protein